MRIFGIDPGSLCTGFGCVDSDGSRHRLVCCGGIKAPARAPFPDRLHHIHTALVGILAECRPDAVAVESLFHARFFEIENLEFHFRKRGELLLRRRKESSGHIAEDVGMQTTLEEG